MKGIKSILIVAVVSLFAVNTSAQSDSGFGIKAGVNYNRSGELTAQIENGLQDLVQGADGRFGYHVGIFAKLEIAKLYVRPELIYTKASSSYDIDGDNTYSTSKIDLPLLVGFNLTGPLHVFAGPALQATIKSDFENFSISNLEKDYTVGLHLGVGVNLGALGVDVRYERGFSENEATFASTSIAGVDGRVDSRPSQVIFSLSYKL